jgi:hypothetical protein
MTCGSLRHLIHLPYGGRGRLAVCGSRWCSHIIALHLRFGCSGGLGRRLAAPECSIFLPIGWGNRSRRIGVDLDLEPWLLGVSITVLFICRFSSIHTPLPRGPLIHSQGGAGGRVVTCSIPSHSIYLSFCVRQVGRIRRQNGKFWPHVLLVPDVFPTVSFRECWIG